MRFAALGALALWLACGPLGPKPDEAAPPEVPARIVTTERGASGGHLILVKEDGTRLADLTRSGPAVAVDSQPAFSPDGEFVVFASTRERARLGRTSLWVIEARSGSSPRRLTSAQTVERDPVWIPGADALVYASNASGSYDLWRLELERGEDGWPRASGDPVRLTDADTDELSPSLSPDGERVVYMAVEPDQRSALWVLGLDGESPRRITDGPADLTPSWAPDGRTIAFAGPVKGRGDTDLYVIGAGGEGRRILVEEPYADQTGPVWSADGRYLFATSLYRSVKTGSPILSSLVVFDTREAKGKLRALHDPVVVESRIGAAVAPIKLDGKLLGANTVYFEALQDAMRKLLQEREFEAEEAREDP